MRWADAIIFTNPGKNLTRCRWFSRILNVSPECAPPFLLKRSLPVPLPQEKLRTFHCAASTNLGKNRNEQTFTNAGNVN